MISQYHQCTSLILIARGPILSNSAKQASAVGSNSTFLEGRRLQERVMLWSCGHGLVHWRLNWKKPRNILLNGQIIEIHVSVSTLQSLHPPDHLSQFQHEVTECASDELTSPRNFDFHVIPPGLLPLPWLFLSATCSGRFQDQIVQSPWGWRAACSKWLKLLSRVLD